VGRWPECERKKGEMAQEKKQEAGGVEGEGNRCCEEKENSSPASSRRNQPDPPQNS